MSSAYPGGLDSFATDKTNATEQADDHPQHHNDLADAVNKIEAELGVNPSDTFDTVAERLDDLESSGGGGGVPTSRTLTAGAGLTGGGDLSADRTFDVQVDNASLEIASDTVRVKTDGITSVHINAGAVGSSELADNAVDTAAIQDGAVTAAKVAADVATQAELDAHTGDTTNAHAASAIGFNPAGGIASTDVQAAIEEVYSENAGGIPQGGPLTTDLDADGNKITDLDDPASPQDAATKAYVDAVAAAGVQADGWIDDTGETWTYASGSGGGVATFTVSGDKTAKYTTGTRIKLTQSATVKYFVCVGSSHAAGTTTVTIMAGTDYTLANSAISANAHSYDANPQGYPGWFAYAPAGAGFSSKSTDAARFSVVGRTCWVEFHIVGTSNSTAFTWALPIAASASARNLFNPATSLDNGGTATTPARVNIPPSATLATMGKNWSGDGGYTASGTKGAQGILTYEI